MLVHMQRSSTKVQAHCDQHVTNHNAGVPIAELDTPL